MNELDNARAEEVMMLMQGLDEGELQLLASAVATKLWLIARADDPDDYPPESASLVVSMFESDDGEIAIRTGLHAMPAYAALVMAEGPRSLGKFLEDDDFESDVH